MSKLVLALALGLLTACSAPAPSPEPAPAAASPADGERGETGATADLPLPEQLGGWSVADTKRFFLRCLQDHWFFTKAEARARCACDGDVMAKARGLDEVEVGPDGRIVQDGVSGDEREGLAACLGDALASMSDRPEGREKAGKWSRRQVEYRADICKNAVQKANAEVTRGDALAFCRCRMRAVAEAVEFVAYELGTDAAEDAEDKAEESCARHKSW